MHWPQAPVLGIELNGFTIQDGMLVMPVRMLETAAVSIVERAVYGQFRPRLRE